MSCCLPGSAPENRQLETGFGPSQQEILLASHSVGEGLQQTEISVPTIHCGGCIQKIERTLGELGPAPTPRGPAQPQERQTIYELYEQNIGLLTPLLAEELSEAVESYPPAWIEDAFREAVAQNKRSWRYVLRILESWSSRGRGTSGTTWRRADPPKHPGDLLESRYGRLIRR